MVLEYYTSQKLQDSVQLQTASALHDQEIVRNNGQPSDPVVQHASELPMFFLPRRSLSEEAGEVDLSHTMSGYWINFANNGDPNHLQRMCLCCAQSLNTYRDLCATRRHHLSTRSNACIFSVRRNNQERATACISMTRERIHQRAHRLTWNRQRTEVIFNTTRNAICVHVEISYRGRLQRIHPLLHLHHVGSPEQNTSHVPT